ncbi:MAG: cell division protein FtsL [Deltaproteobacteria bacterium]|nr:cell division protein FtsL [Deltaproteobacteria bacterium]
MSIAAVWERSGPLAGRGAAASVGAARARGTDRRVVLMAGLGVSMVVGVALLLVWVRLQAVHTGYQLSAARHLVHKLEQEQRELGIEIATLTSPRRLETLARERLGMGPPTPGQIVSVP